MTPISTETKTHKNPQSAPQPRLADVWRVVVLNDHPNAKRYVVLVLQRVLGFSESVARKHMLEAHKNGRTKVWAGQREQAEAYVFAMHRWHLSAVIEPNEAS